MNYIYLLSMLLAVITLTPAMSFANDDGTGPRHRPHGPPSAERLVERLGHELDLTPEQSGDLLVVLKAAEEERHALHQRAREAIAPEICALRAETEAQVRDILDDAQVDQFEQLKADRRERFPERRGHPLSGDECAETAG